MIPRVSGKKVFFVYPHNVIREKLIQELIDREYEFYLINDHNKIESICENYKSPLIFINIDKGLKESEWERRIRLLSENEQTRHANFGILTFHNNEKLSKKYLMDIMVPCGFIQLKQEMKLSTDIIIKTMAANEMNNDRKYLRAKSNSGCTRFNACIMNKIEHGCIVDISSVGMAVCFDKNLTIAKNSYLPDVQLKLKGVLLNVSAVVLGCRESEGEKTEYILKFSNRTSSSSRSKIRAYINMTLQQNMEKKLNLQYV
ncbi:MAG: hypothetical protein JEY91_06965 [Spirochaetaceae bacterium]|nr:hypothetical protein [Spirochaetaceae bacterium]